MASLIKLDIVIPENHRVELTLPDELPAGPAEVIVLPASPDAAGEARGAKKARSLADLFEGRLGLIDSRDAGELHSEIGGDSFVDYLEAKRRIDHL